MVSKRPTRSMCSRSRRAYVIGTLGAHVLDVLDTLTLSALSALTFSALSMLLALQVRHYFTLTVT
jgi:hypothetical protein